MKKFLSLALAMLLVFSVLSPVTVFAENGPYPNDFENVDLENPDTITDLKMSAIMFMDFGAAADSLEEAIGLVYPADAEMPLPDVFSGASYDMEANTLTLKNVKSKTALLEVLGMGDDFKIKLEGYNELSGIMSVGMEWGGAITLIGDGELVLGRSEDALITGLTIEADETASFFHVEDTVKLKFYSNPGLFTDSVSIVGSTITDPAEIIKLGGNVVGDEPVFEKYTVDFFEQAEAYDLEWNCYDWYEFGLEKDGVYYIADEEIDEETYDYTGKYWVYSVTYDEILDCYVLNEYADGEAVSLDGFTVMTEEEPMYDENLGFYIGYTDYPDEEDNSYKTIFDPYEKEPFDLCVDENGTKYGFWQYEYEYDDGTSGTDTYVYNLIDHPTYGLIAVEDKTRTTLDGLTPLKIGEKDYADCYISSDLVINNGGSIIEPAKIKNIKATSNNQGVKISWSADPVAERYRVYRKSASAKNFTYIGTTDAGETSFIDKTAKSGKKYTYTVRGINFVGVGKSNTKGVTHTYYEAPDVTIKNTTSGVNLKWAKVAGATKYRIYRKTAGSEWTRIDTVTGTSFTDKTAKSGKKYYYRVRAGKGDIMGGYNEVSKYFLSVPKLSSIKNTSNGVKISWKEVKGADRYKVYRKHGDGSYEYIGTTEKTYYTDNTGNSGRVYTYTVKAAKSKTTSVYNKTGLKIRWVGTNAFYTPSSVEDGVLLRWEDADRVDKYYIYREVDGTNTKKRIAVLDPDDLERDEYGVLMYVDKTAKNGVTYAYYMRVSYKGTYSAYICSTNKYLTHMDTVDVTSATATKDGIKIKWEKNPYATDYTILRKEKGVDDGFRFYSGTDDGNTTTTLDKDVESGKTYTYAVTANCSKNGGKGGSSAIGGSKSAKAK